MITARELVVLSGSFMSHSKSMMRNRHLRGHASGERYIQSTMLKPGSKSPQASLTTGFEPRPQAFQARSTSYAMVNRNEIVLKTKPCVVDLSTKFQQIPLNSGVAEAISPLPLDHPGFQLINGLLRCSFFKNPFCGCIATLISVTVARAANQPLHLIDFCSAATRVSQATVLPVFSAIVLLTLAE